MNILSWFQKPKEPTYQDLIKYEIAQLSKQLLDEEDRALYHSKQAEYVQARLQYLAMREHEARAELNTRG